MGSVKTGMSSSFQPSVIFDTAIEWGCKPSAAEHMTLPTLYQCHSEGEPLPAMHI